MKKWNLFRIIISIVLLVCFVSGTKAFANDIKARMKARLHQIVALKEQGIVGENNKGYLEYVRDSRAKKEIVDAENQDRKRVYNAIAKQQGATIDVVGSRRAKQIVNKAKPGEWLQDGNGKWYKK